MHSAFPQSSSPTVQMLKIKSFLSFICLLYILSHFISFSLSLIICLVTSSLLTDVEVWTIALPLKMITPRCSQRNTHEHTLGLTRPSLGRRWQYSHFRPIKEPCNGDSFITAVPEEREEVKKIIIWPWAVRTISAYAASPLATQTWAVGTTGLKFCLIYEKGRSKIRGGRKNLHSHLKNYSEILYKIKMNIKWKTGASLKI